MIKNIIAIILTFGAYAAETVSDWTYSNYIKVGAAMPLVREGDRATALYLGLGKKMYNGQLGFDVGSDMFIHPAYQIVLTSVNCNYAPTWLHGGYIGPTVKAGTMIGEGSTITYTPKLIVQVPLTIGYRYKDVGDSLSFIEASVGIDKFLTVSSGVCF